VTAGNANPQVLQEEVLADARRRAEETVRKARHEAEAILAKARADADADRRSRLAAAEAEAARRRDVALAAIPIQVGRRRLECIEAALAAVHDEALRRLDAREGFDYREAVTRLAAQAVAAMDAARFVLDLSDADRQAFGDGWLDEVRRCAGRERTTTAPLPDGRGSETAPLPDGRGSVAARLPDGRGSVELALGSAGAAIRGGVIVRDADGRRAWDNTLAARLERLWPALRRRIAAAAGLVPAAQAAKESP